MRTLILLALAGLGAQLVDGSLGMAYGVTSTTLLLAMGTNPALASATVHLSEIGTTLMSGASHWRFGNVDWKVVAKIGVPGAVGSFLGATVLSKLSTEVAEPVMSLILFGLGLYVMSRFTFRGMPKGNLGKPLRKRFLVAARPGGRVPGRDGRRRLGARRYARAAGQRPDGAAQGDRLDRHQRVPGGRRRQPGLPVLARLPGPELGLGPRLPARRHGRRARRRLAGPPASRHASSAPRSAASSSSPTSVRSSRATGSPRPARSAPPCTSSSTRCGLPP